LNEWVVKINGKESIFEEDLYLSIIIRRVVSLIDPLKDRHTACL